MGDILYSAVVQPSGIVAEAGRAENFRGLVVSIAAQAQPQDVCCVTVKNRTAYYVTQTPYTIVALCAENAPPRVVLGFLKQVAAQIRRDEAPQKALDTCFADAASNVDSLRAAQSEVNQVKQIMVENVDRLLERGERVNLLVDRTAETRNSADLFNRQATHLQRKLWFQNVKVVLIGAVLLVGGVFAVTKVANEI